MATIQPRRCGKRDLQKAGCQSATQDVEQAIATSETTMFGVRVGLCLYAMSRDVAIEKKSSGFHCPQRRSNEREEVQRDLSQDRQALGSDSKAVLRSRSTANPDSAFRNGRSHTNSQSAAEPFTTNCAQAPSTRFIKTGSSAHRAAVEQYLTYYRGSGAQPNIQR